MARHNCKLVFAVLSDGHKIDERGKIDVLGIFANIGVWATPATRECSLTFGLKDVPKGKLNLTFWIRRPGKKAMLVSGQEMVCANASASAMNANRVQLRLEYVGDLEVGVAVGKRLSAHNAIWMPLNVGIMEWPKLPTGKKLWGLLESKTSVKFARANLQCNICDSKYLFQIGLDPKAPLPNEAVPPVYSSGLILLPFIRVVS